MRPYSINSAFRNPIENQLATARSMILLARDGTGHQNLSAIYDLASAEKSVSKLESGDSKFASVGLFLARVRNYLSLGS